MDAPRPPTLAGNIGLARGFHVEDRSLSGRECRARISLHTYLTPLAQWYIGLSMISSLLTTR